MYFGTCVSETPDVLWAEELSPEHTLRLRPGTPPSLCCIMAAAFVSPTHGDPQETADGVTLTLMRQLTLKGKRNTLHIYFEHSALTTREDYCTKLLHNASFRSVHSTHIRQAPCTWQPDLVPGREQTNSRANPGRTHAPGERCTGRQHTISLPFSEAMPATFKCWGQGS